MLARAAALLVLASALAAVGCGAQSSDRTDYVASLNRAQTQLQQRFAAIGERITPTSTPTQDRRSLQAYERVVDGTVASLRAVDPPDGFDALHRRFVAELAGYGTAVHAARARLSSDDPRSVLAAQGALNASVTKAGRRLNATIAAINEKIEG